MSAIFCQTPAESFKLHSTLQRQNCILSLQLHLGYALAKADIDIL